MYQGGDDMQTIISVLRSIIGDTSGFWHEFSGSGSYNSYNWDYGMMLEYAFACILLLCVVNWVFRLLRGLFQ